jgi:hypothetical protein
MNLLRRLLPGIALIIGTFLVSIGFHVLAFTEPSAGPTGGTVYVPLNTGSNWQSKAGGLDLNTSGAYAAGLIVSSGNVGIGTASPGAKLEVAGQVKITGGTPGAGKILTSDASGLATWTTPAGGGGSQNLQQVTDIGYLTTRPLQSINSAGGASLMVGIDSSSRRMLLDYSGSDFASIQGGVWGGTTRPLVLQGGGGGVGIGTTNPQAKIDIQDSDGNRLRLLDVWNGDFFTGLTFQRGGSSRAAAMGMLKGTNSYGVGVIFGATLKTSVGFNFDNDIASFVNQSGGGLAIENGANRAMWVGISGGIGFGNYITDPSFMTIRGAAESNPGFVGIGTTNPGLPLEVVGATWGQARLRYAGSANYWNVGSDSGNAMVVGNQSGIGVYLLNGETSWRAMSDIRLKEKVLPVTDALQKVLKMRGVVYNLKDNNTREIGVIAQEVQPYFPELVSINSDGYLGVSYDRIAPVLIEAIKEQQKEIEALKADIEELKSKLK